MKVSGESESLATTNRVPIHRALVFADQNHPPDQLGPYLTILDKYDPAKLDPPGLLQLVRAFDEGGLFARAAKAGQAGILATPADGFGQRTGGGAAGRRPASRPAGRCRSGSELLARGRQGTSACSLEGGMRDRGGRPRDQRSCSCRARPRRCSTRRRSDWERTRNQPSPAASTGSGATGMRQGRQVLGPGRLRSSHGRAGHAKIRRRARRLARRPQPVDRGVPPRQSP